MGETPTSSVGLTNVQAPGVSTGGQLQLKTIADTALWTEKLSLMFLIRMKGKSAKSSTHASTLDEAADLLFESQEIEVVNKESTVNSDHPLAENVRSNGKEERQVVSEGIYCCLQYKTIIHHYSKQILQIHASFCFQDIFISCSAICSFFPVSERDRFTF